MLKRCLRGAEIDGTGRKKINAKPGESLAVDAVILDTGLPLRREGARVQGTSQLASEI